jgi:hypothetical protein
MRPFRIRLRLKLAVACFAYVGLAVLNAQPAPEQRVVEIETDHGTPCPRPCLFPQLEAQR